MLRDAGITYKWGFPVKLIIFKDDSQVVFLDLDATRDLLEPNLHTRKQPKKEEATVSRNDYSIVVDKNSPE